MGKKPADIDAGAIFQKSMQDAIANLDKVTEEARKAHEEAIDLQIAAKDEIHRIELEAENISRDFIDKHRKEFENTLRDQLHLGMIKKLIMYGMKSSDLITVLDVKREMLAEAWNDLGFDKLGELHVANVSYQEQGRAGNILFYREDVMLKFWYEFGGGLSLAFINVPKVETWTSETGLPLDDRLPILNFIGERVVRDKARGYKYEIKEDSINITL